MTVTIKMHKISFSFFKKGYILDHKIIENGLFQIVCPNLLIDHEINQKGQIVHF